MRKRIYTKIFIWLLVILLGFGACILKKSLEELFVEYWDNSTSWNGGRTGIGATNVWMEADGNQIRGSLDYHVFDCYNPSAIAQLFIAVERKIVVTLYDGIPGCGGVKGSESFSFSYDSSKFGSSATIYLVGTWAYSVEQGKYHYEHENGGWRCSIGRVKVIKK